MGVNQPKFIRRRKMNKFEDLANNDVCIRDLTQLGREGGASTLS